MNSEPTVFIVDDDPAVRRGLSVLVESMDLQAETYASAQEFLKNYDNSRPGCMLLDVRLPEISGLELLDRIAGEEGHLPVILISAYGDVPTAVRGMKAGALNFLEKPCRGQQLWEAIQEALKKDAGDRKKLAHRRRIRRRLGQLSEAEQDVLKLLVHGRSNKAIAAQLGLSVRTIEVRRAKLMKKMKAASLAELVRSTLSAGNPFG